MDHGRAIKNRTNGRLARRLSLAIGGAVAVAALLLGAFGLAFTWIEVNAGFDQQLLSIATLASLRMEADKVALVKTPPDQNLPEYKEMAGRLNTIMKSQGLAYAYTMVLGEKDQPVLMIDGSDDPEEIGTTYLPDPALDQLYKTKKPTVGAIMYEAPYGRLKTGFAPILNSRGELDQRPGDGPDKGANHGHPDDRRPGRSQAGRCQGGRCWPGPDRDRGEDRGCQVRD